MIPLKLSLRNFMCYRGDSQTLDFSGIHLACLAGDNGHGKSALLDAITWALWGKSRAKRDDELISLGETEMEVEFEFRLGEVDYRVIRKRDSSDRGQSLLELQARHDDGFRSLTGDSIRHTEARIIELLHMDYETFTNSAFLLQNRADEFTIKPPAERKRILGEILGLSIYDQFEERAKERIRQKEAQENQLTAHIQEMERELVRRPEYEAERRTAEEEVAQLGASLRAGEEELRRLREARRELDLKQSQRREMTERLAATERELAQARRQVEEHERQIAGYEATLTQAQAIEAGFAQLLAARQVNEELNRRLTQLVKLNEEKGRLETAIAEARHHLTLEQRLCLERRDELAVKVEQAASLETELAGVQQELAHLSHLEAEREAHRTQVQALSQEITALQTINQQLKEEMALLKEKLDLLQEAVVSVGKARCPLCQNDLTPADYDRLVAQFRAEGQGKGDTYRANQTRIQKLTARGQGLREQIETADRELRRLAACQKREATLEKTLAEAREAEQELSRQRQKAAALQQQLEKYDYAVAEQQQLASLVARIQALGYDAEAHETVRQRFVEYGPFEESKRELDKARQLLDGERKGLARAREAEARWRKALADDQAGVEALRRELADLEEVPQRLVEQQRRVDELQASEAHARQMLGAAQQKLDHCQYLAREREVKLAELRQVAEERGIYEELRVAFGKKGLPAMIIESAIPEIEEEANRILARMTDGRMHVRFETQREARAGHVIETLDIKISDELGTRDYFLYSGGETFLANFAIRIALSKLLARRAGARLQTLVIDEGFGTQDAQGRERLVEAINSIQDDFAKIIVVTHIEELRDAFPVRIDVFKTPAGSRITVA